MENSIYQSEKGYVAYKVDGQMCYIEFVNINEDARHSGNGTKMMNDFFNDNPLCNQFFVNVFFNLELYNKDTSMNFKRLVSFYETLGFEKDEKEWENIINSDDLEEYNIFMTKIV